MDSALTSLLQEIAREEDFCVPDAAKGDRLKPLLKALYDGACEATKRSFGPLRTLVVEGLDEESIWEQVQTRKNLTRFAEKRVSALDRKIAQRAKVRAEEQQQQQQKKKKSKKRVTMQIDSDEDEEFNEDSEERTDEEEEEEEGSEEGSFGDEDSDAHEEDDNEEDGEEEEEEEGEEDNEDGEEEEDAERDGEDDNEEDEEAAVRAATQRLEAFDEDVKMEAWLDAFEEDEQRHKERAARKERRAAASTVESREWDDEDQGEDDLEFIGNHLYEDSDDEEEEELDPRSIRYEDFFVDDSRKGKKSSSAAAANKKRRAAEESDEEEEEDDEEEREEGESDEDDMDMDFDGVDDYEDSAAEDEDDEEEDYENEEDVGAGQKKKSQESFSTAFQKRKQELQQQISELEKSLVADKSWELKGEVKATHRPENSLLSVPVDVERSVKVAPLITQDYTTSLEEKIIERIKAGRFDDPSPAHAAPDNVITDNVGPDEGDLSQEKSKVGLGELYAEEYAKKLENSGDTLDVQTQAVRDEAINLYNAVARQLDALTHFFFTPKPVAAEANAKVLATQRAMPALEMEDITPFGQNSTGSAVAPEQVLEKKRGKAVTLLTSAELTREDRKKLRRHKKAVRKAEKKAQEKDTSVKNLRKQAEKKLTEELKADKRVVLAQEGGKKAKHEDSNQYGKSSSFFSKLQQESQQQIASKAGKPSLKRKREEDGPAKSSSGFKL